MSINPESQYTKTQYKSKPKRITSKPKAITIILFIMTVIIWVPHTLPFFTNQASGQIFATITLLPLAIIGLFLSFHTGLTLAKMRAINQSNNIVSPFLALIILQVMCIIGCILIEMTLAGYPFKACFDICQYSGILEAIIAYTIVTTLLFIPAHGGIKHYNNWAGKK